MCGLCSSRREWDGEYDGDEGRGDNLVFGCVKPAVDGEVFDGMVVNEDAEVAPAGLGYHRC